MQDIMKVLVPVAVTHVVVLAVIIFIIRRMLLGETMQAVNRIRQVEAEVRKKEESIRAEIEEHEKAFVQKKAEAEDELQRRRQQMETELGKVREQIAGDAKKEADRIIDQAKKNEEKMRKQLAQQVEERAVEYGSEVFKLVFTEKMTQELDKQFIDELLDALDQVDGSSITVDAANAEFFTSGPMDAAQKSRLEKLLDEKFGAKVKVQEKIRKELMAGLILKMGSLEVDGSLLNRFQEAAAEVKKTIQV